MKALTYSIISLFAGLLVLVWLIIFIGPTRLIEPFREFSFQYMAFFLGLSAIVMFLSIYRWVFLLKRFNLKVPFWTAFQYYLMGHSISYIAPLARMAGAPLKAYMLTKHKIPIEKGISVIIIDNIVENTFDLIFSAIFASFVIFTIASTWPISYLIIGVIVIALLVCLFFLNEMRKGTKVFTYLATFFGFLGINSAELKKKGSIADSMFHDFMTTHFSVLPFLSLISLITWSIAILQYKTALLALGYDLPIMQLFLIIIFLVIAPLIPIPASIGVLELGQYSVFLFLGIDPLVGVALALLVRFRDIIWVMLGLIFSFSYGFSSFKDAIWKTSEKP